MTAWALVLVLVLGSSTDRPAAAHGEMAELLCQGPHHGGGLDGHGVLQARCQDGALREEKQHGTVGANQMHGRETVCESERVQDTHRGRHDVRLVM